MQAQIGANDKEGMSRFRLVPPSAAKPPTALRPINIIPTFIWQTVDKNNKNLHIRKSLALLGTAHGVDGDSHTHTHTRSLCPSLLSASTSCSTAPLGSPRLFLHVPEENTRASSPPQSLPEKLPVLLVGAVITQMRSGGALRANRGSSWSPVSPQRCSSTAEARTRVSASDALSCQMFGWE